MTQPHGEHASLESTRANGTASALPPFMGEWATAEPGLLQEAILRVLDANPEAWEMVFDRLDQAPEPREAAVETVEEVAELSASPAEHVRQVLHLVAARDHQFGERLRTEASRRQGPPHRCRLF